MRSAWRARLRSLTPAWVRRRLGYSKSHRRTAASPDRVLLVDEILPRFAEAGGTILWVGVRRYTEDYPARLERRGATCWTLEIDPTNALWGHPERHVTADLLDVAKVFAPGQFDAVLCNGVLGHGVDSPEAQAAAFEAMAQVTRPGGWLLLGWNTGTMPDPLEHLAFTRRWEPAAFGDLPARRRVPGVTHVYDIARRRQADAQST